MNAPAAVRRIEAAPLNLTVEWDGGPIGQYPSFWLRDNQPEDRDPYSGQRLIDIADLPEEPRIRSASLRGDALRIEWEGDPRHADFDLAWLMRHAGTEYASPWSTSRKLWANGAALDAARDFDWLTIEQLRLDGNRRAQWLARLLQDGIAFVSELGSSERALLDAAGLVGRVSETNYGKVFDVRSVAQPENLAYSDRGLGLHTDNPYREPVPGFQALHALRTSDEGGDSLFADGLAVAEHLRDSGPEAFALLAHTPVPFHFRSKDAELQAWRPLIQLGCDGAIVAVHYNSRSIAPLPPAQPRLDAFYAAYRRFSQLLRERRRQLKFRLRDGDLVVFDNQRILHGRTGFSALRHPRHLRGCYLTRDSVYSEAAMLRRHP